MAFPTGWGRKCAVVIANAQVAGTSHTDFPVLVTAGMLPSEMFDADGTYPALSGGGDVRFSSDSAGATRLACEVVSFVTDNNPANGSAEIWVKVPTLSGSVDTTIYVWYKKAAETQPAVTDTYGRNAVWSDYLIAAHLRETSGTTAVDSSGNRNGTYVHTPVAQGLGQSFDGVDDRIVFGTAALGITTAFTFQARIKPDTVVGDGQIFSSDSSTGTVDRNFQFRVDDGFIRLIRFNSTNNVLTNYVSSSGVSASTVYSVSATFNTTSGSVIYVDGSAAGTEGTTTANGDQSGAAIAAIGDRYRTNLGWNSEPYDGEIGSFRVLDSARSADWITTEYNNQNSPATFATAGTPESVSAGLNYQDGAFSASGTATTSFTGQSVRPAALAADGQAQVAFAGRAVAQSAFASTGTSSTAFTGRAVSVSAFASVGESATAFTGQGLASSVFSAGGTSAVSFLAEVSGFFDAAFSSAGTSDTAFVGRTIAQATASATGAASVSWVAIVGGYVDAVFQIEGATAVQWRGASVAQSDFAADGASVTSFSAQTIRQGAFAAAGTSATAFESRTVIAAQWHAVGTAEGAFAGQYVASSDFSALGSSSVSFVSDIILQDPALIRSVYVRLGRDEPTVRLVRDEPFVRIEERTTTTRA